jgi:2-polyprenyl-3-methyl-5-hydroxy-6-metoxy-1,4-benzoquinol methylase
MTATHRARHHTRSPPAPNNPRVVALLDAVPEDGSILDIGCVQHDAGNADDRNWLHGHLYARSREVLGVDILEDGLAELRSRGYDVTYADAEALNLGREFDTIVAGELIEHLSNVGAFLDGVRQHLRDDGQFLLTTPNPWAALRFRELLFSGAVNVNSEHTCWLEEWTIRQVFDRHGFETDVEYIRPKAPGATSLLYQLGFDVIGGTHLLVRACQPGRTRTATRKR